MMLKPSIDTLLEKIPSKYSLVMLEAKRAHELEQGAAPTMSFTSKKSTLQALEEIEAGLVTIHPNPEKKREMLRLKAAAEKRRLEEEERRLREEAIKARRAQQEAEAAEMTEANEAVEETELESDASI